MQNSHFGDLRTGLLDSVRFFYHEAETFKPEQGLRLFFNPLL